ncbi:hypothetical protein ABZP36_001304 [Zizania latifolia]
MAAFVHVAVAPSSPACCLTRYHLRVAPPASSAPLARLAATDDRRRCLVVRCQNVADDQPSEPGPEEKDGPQISSSNQHWAPPPSSSSSPSPGPSNVLSHLLLLTLAILFLIMPFNLSFTTYKALDDSTLFDDEKNKINEYLKEIHYSNKCFLYRQGRELARSVCFNARHAINLASKIMAYAGLRAQTQSEISLHTVEQTMRIYVSIFLKTAEDTYHRKVDRADILSFLDALGGLAAISHILFEDALVSVRGSSPNYSPTRGVKAINRYFHKKMRHLRNNFTEAKPTEALEHLIITMNDAMVNLTNYVTAMNNLRQETLAHVSAGSAVGSSSDATPPVDTETE